MSLGNDVARLLTQKHPELKDTLFDEIGQIVATACLAHDMGNPPFGHSGEKAIQTFFTEGPGLELQRLVCHEFWDDITHFEGNANAFRLLAHQFEGRRQGGFVMTYSTLASIVKYPFSSSAASKKGKFGFFCSEKAIYQKIADELGIFCISKPGDPLRYVRHPLVYLNTGRAVATDKAARADGLAAAAERAPLPPTRKAAAAARSAELTETAARMAAAAGLSAEPVRQGHLAVAIAAAPSAVAATAALSAAVAAAGHSAVAVVPPVPAAAVVAMSTVDVVRMRTSAFSMRCTSFILQPA